MLKHSIILIPLLLSSTCLADNHLTWIAQDYPPYSYVDNNGNNAGIAIDIASALMRNLNTGQAAQSIELKVFSKFFIMMNNNDNTVFFPLLRLPAREQYFQWVGPIGINEPVLMAKTSSNIVINAPTDLNQYNIASIEGYDAVNILTAQGVNNNVFQLNSSDLEDAKLLVSDAVNIIACDKLACKVALIAAGADPAGYSIIYQMPSSEFYFAFNKNTSSALISQIQISLDQMKEKNGTGLSAYDQIVKKYNN